MKVVSPEDKKYLVLMTEEEALALRTFLDKATDYFADSDVGAEGYDVALSLFSRLP